MKKYRYSSTLPLKKVTKKEFKRRFKPWISNEVLHKIDQKNNAFKKYINCKDTVRKAGLKNQYLQLKYEATFLTRNAKKTIIKNTLLKIKKISKKYGKGLRKLLT